MTSRLEPSPLTREDCYAEVHVWLRWRATLGAARWGLMALRLGDRRDADLMLQREQWIGEAPPAEAWCCGDERCFWCGEQFPVGAPVFIDITATEQDA